MKELPLSLTEAQAKQLFEYFRVVEEQEFEYGNRKQFRKRHEIMVDRIQGIIYEFKQPHYIPLSQPASQPASKKE